ncbi:MAG: TetR/AcrR family transcriptional regulator [Pseudomonadota bacterium]
MTAQSEQSPKGEARRLAIIRDARRILLKDGYVNLSLRQIATNLGMSVGNLQYYFPTKDSLVQATIADETDRALGLLWEITWTPDNMEDCVENAVRSLLNHYASDAGQFYSIAEFLALHDPDYAKLKSEAYHYIFGYITKLIGLVAPELDSEKRMSLAHVFVAIIDGASLQVQLAASTPKARAFEQLIADTAKAIILLIRTWE